jgi:CheY-like chemotaxis protein
VKSILLVEDSRFLRKATERVLLKAGFNVVTACDGEEALQVAFSATPDLILLDMLLPKLSGPDVLRALRKHPQTQDTPVIVLSGLCQANEKKLTQEGATAYLQKANLDFDGDGESLIQAIQTVLLNTANKENEDALHR